MVEAEPNLPEKFMPLFELLYSERSLKPELEPKAFDQTPLSPPSGTRKPAGHGS